MVKSRRPGPAGWIPGRITEKNGPLTYVGGEKKWKCHVDQLKACMENVASKAVPESGTDFEYTTATDDEERLLIMSPPLPPRNHCRTLNWTLMCPHQLQDRPIA